MSKNLGDIRKKIDSIDNHVHDLLMERAELVSSVSAAKKKDGLQVVQPAREARMMRRLLARHKGPLPRKTIVRIWRELVGSVSLLQAGLSVSVSPGKNENSFWDMAKNYFGSAIPMTHARDCMAAISMVCDEKESFAVMPWPEMDDNSPWWEHVFDNETLSIICALPYGTKRDENSVNAVVVSEMGFMSSDDDISFIGIRTSSKISKSHLRDKVEEARIRLLNVYNGPSNKVPGTDIYLLEVGGFFDDKSHQIENLKQLLGDQCSYCAVVGGYPVIPDIAQ